MNTLRQQVEDLMSQGTQGTTVSTPELTNRPEPDVGGVGMKGVKVVGEVPGIKWKKVDVEGGVGDTFAKGAGGDAALAVQGSERQVGGEDVPVRKELVPELDVSTSKAEESIDLLLKDAVSKVMNGDSPELVARSLLRSVDSM